MSEFPVDDTMTPEERAQAEDIHQMMYDGRTRWKYKYVTVNTWELESQLNTYGHFGWELVSITPLYKENYYREGRLELTGTSTVLFKQPYWLERPNE